MNHLQFFLKAKTEYNLHSPFVFDLYSKVLFAPMHAALCQKLQIAQDDRYHQLVFKQVNYLRPRRLWLPAVDAVAERCCHQGWAATQVAYWPADNNAMNGLEPSEVLMCPAPHASSDLERQWEQWCALPSATITIDLYFAGLVFFDPRLSRQRFFLRG